jgi:hypothetical protein
MRILALFSDKAGFKQKLDDGKHFAYLSFAQITNGLFSLPTY